ncbi:putative DNA binding domain-containing protein [Candidatus Woesearchaeota archaeon]|nr:putative DNA binding domain-containing protein [Candidatus Woesearchaeota archaeon]
MRKAKIEMRKIFKYARLNKVMKRIAKQGKTHVEEQGSSFKLEREQVVDANFIIEVLKKGEGLTVEFKKSIPETYKKLSRDICALANSEGGFIFIGVDDDGRILGVQKHKIKEILKKVNDGLMHIYPKPSVHVSVVEISDKSIIVVKVEKSKSITAVGNIAYVRIGENVRPLSIEELGERLVDEMKIYYDELECKQSSLRDINKSLVKKYVLQRKVKGLPVSKSLKQLMIKAKLLTLNGKPTNACVLCFGINPSRFIYGAKVRIIEWHSKDSFTLIQEIDEPIPIAISKVMDVLSKLVKRIEVKTLKERVIVEEYPLKALKEAVTNALTHRNYYVDTPIFIELKPGEIQITNPGELPSRLRIESPRHIPRNPVISDCLWVLGFIEAFGTGIANMRSICEQHPLVRFYIHSDQGETIVRFVKEKLFTQDSLAKKILDLLVEPLSSSQISSLLGVSKPSVIARLKTLQSMGLVKSLGKGRGLKYIKSEFA